MSHDFDLGDRTRSGTWFVGPGDLVPLAEAAVASGLAVCHIDLAGCSGKPEALKRIADALAFPATFGNNWDALADCIGDLAWRPAASGHVWLFAAAGELRDAAEADFDTLCSVLDDACGRWRDRGLACFAFLELPANAFPPTLKSA